MAPTIDRQTAKWSMYPTAGPDAGQKPHYAATEPIAFHTIAKAHVPGMAALLIGDERIHCRVIEGDGSRVRFEKSGVVASFHRPHPGKEVKHYQVRDARDYLTKIGMTP